MRLPEGHQAVMPYLILCSADRFRDFVAEVFGAADKARFLGNDGRVMHAETEIAGSTIMYADSTDVWMPNPGSMYTYVENLDEVHAKALKAGAREIMPLEHRDYGYASGVLDPTGNTWWFTQAK